MLESDLVSEIMLSERGNVRGIRIDRREYPIWPTNGARYKCRVDDLVIKFDLGGDDGQSYKEGWLSSRIQVPDRKYFVEVRHLGVAKDMNNREYWWVAQPYLDIVVKPPPVDDNVARAAREKKDELCERYSLDDLGGAVGHNWTILGTDPLIYDYGFGFIRDRVFKRT